MLQTRRRLTIAAILLGSLCISEQHSTPGDPSLLGLPTRQFSIAFPKAYVDAHIRDAAQKFCTRPRVACTSMMGPTCFYSEVQGENISDRNASSWLGYAGLPEEPTVAAREDEHAASSGGIMERYMEASQQQLGAVHGIAEAPNNSPERWQRIGAAREGRLDDVVRVRVGRDVQSVYEEHRHGADAADVAGSGQVCQDDGELRDKGSNSAA